MKMTNENNTIGTIQNDNLAAEDSVQNIGDTAMPNVYLPVTGYSLNKKNITLKRGERTTLKVTIAPPNATNANPTWESAAPYVASVTATASVDGNEATVSANHVGTTTIYVKQQSQTNVVSDSCQVTVEPDDGAVRAITISPSAATLDVGEQLQLSASFTPANATNKTLDWRSSDTNVVAVNSSNGKALAKSTGTAIITAIALDGSGVTAKCVISVGKELVVISRDSEYSIDGSANGRNYNKVEFTNSGKVWHCIDEDTIFNPNNVGDSVLSERSNYNFYRNKNDNSVITTYTSDELRLLYAIDPYGVADYVQRYADELSDDLGVKIGYKNDIFEVLFGRKAKWYARYADTGNWYETTATDLSKVISESELIFGLHSVYDMTTIVQLAELAVDVIQCIWEVFLKDLVKNNPGWAIIGKVFLGFLAVGEAVLQQELQSYANGAAIEEAMQGIYLDWVVKLMSVSDVIESFNDVLATLFVDTTYFEKTLEYCYDQTPYAICVVRSNDETAFLEEIHSRIMAITE